MIQRFYVCGVCGRQQFETKKEACSYAKTASLMFGKSVFTVYADALKLKEYYQGKVIGAIVEKHSTATD